MEGIGTLNLNLRNHFHYRLYLISTINMCIGLATLALALSATSNGYEPVYVISGALTTLIGITSTFSQKKVTIKLQAWTSFILILIWGATFASLSISNSGSTLFADLDAYSSLELIVEIFMTFVTFKTLEWIETLERYVKA